MSGEDFFKFNSGKEFRFSNFKEIKEEDLKGADEKIKKLFNIFAGDDKVLQVNEAQSLFNALKSAAGNNKTLETDEIKMFTEEKIGEEVDTNIFTTFVNNLFGTKDKTQNQSVQVAQSSNTSKSEQIFLEEAACKEIVIDIIDENLSEAYEILNSQYLGAISGWHDARKDKNDILKTSNVAKVLDYQNAGVEWMNKAKLTPPNGLTKKEYYEGNKQRIKDMILTRVLVLDTNTKFKELKNKYSEEKLAQIIGDYVEALCSNATMADLKNIQKNFVSYSGVEEIQALENVVDNAIKFNEDKNKPMPAGELAGIKLNQPKGIIPEYWNSNEPISFEEVYKIERGTEYSQYKIEKYTLAKKEMEVVANAYNKKQQFVEFADNLRKDETLNADDKAQKVLEGFADFYALSEDGGLSQLKELIKESKLPISIDENGFNFGTLDDNDKNRALNSLLKLTQQSKEKEFEEFLNGKTIEEYQTTLEEAQKEAIGEENGKLMAEAMKNDNLTCIQRWTGNTSMLGMGMTVVGGILCFTPLAPLGAGMVTAGNTLAIGGMVAETGLGVADYATKDVQTVEEAEQLGKNFITNAGGFIIGIGAGKAGMKAFNKLIDEKLVAVFGKQIAGGNKAQALKTVFTNPKYLKSFMTAAGAKLSADFVISYAGDLAMMGVLDTDDNWQSLLKANLTGILVGMSGDIKDVSGVVRPRNLGVSNGVKPMTEFDYGQRLLGNDVTIVDPKTGTNIDGTVTGLHTNNGQVEIEVNGQRYSTNDVSGVRTFKNERESSDGTTGVTSRLGYEVSRNINRGKRAVQYIEDKTAEAYQGTKKVVKGVSKLIDTVYLDRRLKNFGIKNEYTRETVIEFLKKTPIESEEIYNGLLKSIKTMKEMDIRDNDFQSILYHISNNNKKFDQSSLDIINELSNLRKLAGKSWKENTADSLLFNGKNNAERLEYLKEFCATLDAGYEFEDIKYMLSAGIKGEDDRKTYEEILNSEFIQRTKGGLGAEYKAKEYFKTCTDADGKFSYEYWKMIQNMDKHGIKYPENIFKILKNDDVDITSANIETLITKINENPTNIYQYTSSLIEKCMTKDGRLDFSLMDSAKEVNKFGHNFNINLVKNEDGSFNKFAINTIQELQSNGFKNEDIQNILAAAKKHSSIAEGELYSQEIIKKSIELKNAGVKSQNIGNMLNDCIENGKLDNELLENIIPICKMLDTYSLTETEFIIPLLKNYTGNTQKQTADQIQRLVQNGFSTHDIVMSKIFNFKGSYGSITPDNIIEAAIQLKQAGFSWNIKEILAKSRFDDGTLNTESLNLIIDLKNKGISENYLDNIIEIVTTEKGELLKDNIETVLSLLKEFKDSEFCNSKKDTKQNSQDDFVIYVDTAESKSDYISEHGNNIRLVNTLIKMSSDEAGNINTKVLNANKARLMSLYNKLEAEDKDMFVTYAMLAANKQGAFDENIFNKINELKYLDDGFTDPNYHLVIRNFLRACKDENGNLDIQKYNDAVKLVKNYGFSKHKASYTIDLYEELKPYQGKNFVYDLSITEKRQLQSLLLSHSNNLEGLAEVKKILKTNIIPTTDTDYSTLMKQLSQSLGNTDFVLDGSALDNLHNNMTKLAQTLSTGKPIEQVSVDITYNDLLKRIKSKMSGLSESEKRKIYDYFGFNVKDGEIVGFPSYLGKNIEVTDITNSFTRKVVQAVTSEIENFNKNNNITVKDNPELSQILTSISKSVPEVYNKFSSSEKSVQTLKTLKTITKNPNFTKLNENEKQILILGALLKDSNVGTIKETAFNIYNLSSKFNMSNTDRVTLYKLLSIPDAITEYKNAKSVKESFNNRFGSPSVEYDKKELALDMLAFKMKDHKLDDLSYLLYSTGENRLITPELQKELKQRIFEIKSDDFILPQTHTQAIKDHVTTQTINGYIVQVANASEIPNFYAYVHTPDAGAVNNSSRITKFSNFEEFQNIDSDAVICTSYISADKSATWLDNGFIFEIGSGNEYVGMGHDMYSLGKNKSQVVAEYYRDKGLKALSGKGYKYSHRSFISSHLKDILHITENSYSDLIANKRNLNSELESLSPNSPEAAEIQTQIAKIESELQRINEDYVTRIDKVKKQISSDQINLEEIRNIDPELADAYEKFLARDNTGHKFGKEALMRNDYWNEVLVSNPKISAIYTKNIDKLPIEYLEKAQKEGIPIVVINRKEV